MMSRNNCLPHAEAGKMYDGSSLSSEEEEAVTDNNIDNNSNNNNNSDNSNSDNSNNDNSNNDSDIAKKEKKRWKVNKQARLGKLQIETTAKKRVQREERREVMSGLLSSVRKQIRDGQLIRTLNAPVSQSEEVPRRVLPLLLRTSPPPLMARIPTVDRPTVTARIPTVDLPPPIPTYLHICISKNKREGYKGGLRL